MGWRLTDPLARVLLHLNGNISWTLHTAHHRVYCGFIQFFCKMKRWHFIENIAFPSAGGISLASLFFRMRLFGDGGVNKALRFIFTQSIFVTPSKVICSCRSYVLYPTWFTVSPINKFTLFVTKFSCIFLPFLCYSSLSFRNNRTVDGCRGIFLEEW